MSGKTNAMRILDSNHITYNVFSFDPKGIKDGSSVAKKINRPLNTIYKTLVTHHKENIYIFVIPVELELDLKKAARVAGEKNVQMIAMKNLQKYTGYIRGGCSPIGMKRLYPIFIDDSAQTHSQIIISAGKVGMMLELDPLTLSKIVDAPFVELVKS